MMSNLEYSEILIIEDYIQVYNEEDISYGGSQGWFCDSSRLLGEYGCGVISGTDVELYLDSIRCISKDEYCRIAMSNYKGKYKFRSPIGLFPGKLRKKLAKKYNANIRWVNRLSRSFSETSIFNMLRDKKPVLVAYNRLFRREKDKLRMYKLACVDENGSCELSRGTYCFSHFFVVTGIADIDKERYMIVSSNGKKLYVSMKDFMRGDFFSGMMLFS